MLLIQTQLFCMKSKALQCFSRQKQLAFTVKDPQEHVVEKIYFHCYTWALIMSHLGAAE